MPAPSALIKLVKQFEDNRETYIPEAFSETSLRLQFIDPMFELLGWDVYNRQGNAEAFKDVVHEDAIKIGGSTKAPDYSFRIGGTRIFFVEAKKPSVKIKQDTAPAFQLRRYAWSAKLPLSILTDFEEFAVYDCRVRPDKTDAPSMARTMYFTFDQYNDRWDEIAGIFSREAVLKGSFDRYAESTKKKRGTAEVDAAFLDDIEQWRVLLACNLALRNPQLSQRDLNFAVQKTIDRIVFLRICEDRGMETYGRLQVLPNGPSIYPRLCELFREADHRYNSGLFHFAKKKERHEIPDEWTLSLAIDDSVLKDMIRKLYYPESPYEFSVIGADILGQVYEQFLGKAIRLTTGHQAKVEEKPEVRKAGGVYYTPTYIVDYIVKNTVGKLLEGKTPHDVAARTQAWKPAKGNRPLSVLDPACGGGSFLIGAYQYLLDWYRDWFLADNPLRHKDRVFQTKQDQWRLTTAERKRILLDHIFGVDIDPQAVEVTKLSLLLKVLEGETKETLQRQLFAKQRALPDLAGNIKCGNSLMGPDFFNGHQLSLFDENERLHVNVFDWHNEFSGIMGPGGFDAVIGNPPWGASFTGPELEYLREHYSRVIARMIDSFIYFIDRAIQVTTPRAPIGFIVPSTILNQVDTKPVRELLLRRGLTVIVNLGQGVFGRKVLNTSTIFISEPQKRLVLGNLSAVPLTERSRALAETKTISWKAWCKQVESDPHQTFFTGSLNGTALLQRLQGSHSPLSRFVSGTIQRGVSPDVVAAHVVSTADARSLRLEVDLLRASVSGPQIKRYRDWKPDQFIIYTSRDTPIREYPRVLTFLEQFRGQNTCKEVVAGKHPWWSLHRPRDPGIFAAPKFIGLTTSKTIELIYDQGAAIYVTDAMYVFRTVSGVDPWAFMAIMQSRLFLFLYRISNQGESRVIPQVKASKISSLPFPTCDQSHPALAKLRERCQQMYSLHRQHVAAQIPHEQTTILRQIATTESQIDRLVYGLYGLTNEEILIVEEIGVA